MEETSEENMLKADRLSACIFLLEIDLIRPHRSLVGTHIFNLALLMRDQNVLRLSLSLSLSLSLAFDSYNSTAAAPNAIR